MDCSKCNLAVTINQIKCSGFCGKMFHYGCAGVDRVAYNQTLKCPNIMWFCCDCRDLLKNQSFIKLMNNHSCAKIAQQPLIEKLLDEVAYIKQQFGTILDRIPLLGSADVTTEESTSIIAETTGSVFDVPAVTQQSSKSSMPSSFDASQTFAEVVKSPAGISATTSPSRIATKAATDQLKLSSNDGKIRGSQHFNQKPICGTKNIPVAFGIKTVVPMFWIHLSRFDSTTSEEDILGMVKTCLDTDVCKINKLIPKNSNIHQLEYICFKLGINYELRNKALDPATWPVGVFIRGFNTTNFRTSLPPHVKFRVPAVTETVPA